MSNSTLSSILDELYRVEATEGDGTTAWAIQKELEEGTPVKLEDSFLYEKGARNLSRLADLLTAHRKNLLSGGSGLLTAAEEEIVKSEFDRLYAAMLTPDKTGNVTEWVNGNAGRAQSIGGALGKVIENYDVRATTGAEFDESNSYKPPRPTSPGKMSTLVRGVALLDWASFGVNAAQDGVEGAILQYEMDTLCGVGMCPPLQDENGVPLEYIGDGLVVPAVPSA